MANGKCTVCKTGFGSKTGEITECRKCISNASGCVLDGDSGNAGTHACNWGYIAGDKGCVKGEAATKVTNCKNYRQSVKIGSDGKGSGVGDVLCVECNANHGFRVPQPVSGQACMPIAEPQRGKCQNPGNDTGTECAVCLPEFYLSGTECKRCDADAVFGNSGAQSCMTLPFTGTAGDDMYATTCKRGFFVSANYNCVACAKKGCTCNTSTGHCVSMAEIPDEGGDGDKDKAHIISILISIVILLLTC
jgi:hypothetical protein